MRPAVGFIDQTPPDPLAMAWWECNDYGNGRRLVALARGLVKWVDDSYWIAWDGKRWSETEGEYRARHLAHEVAAHLHEEAAALGQLIGDPKSPDLAALRKRYGDWVSATLAVDRLAMLHKHALKSGNAAQTNGMLNQAKAMSGVRARGDEFDADPLAYNVQNGTLRFRMIEGSRDETNRFGLWRVDFQPEHEPADMIRQIAGVDYDPAATCPQWIERLALVQPDEEQRGILPRLYGQTLTGLTDCEEFYVHQGQGGDGKTKTHEIIADIHGDYYRHSGVKTFLQGPQKSGSDHRSDLHRLMGDIRMVVCDEPPPMSVWDSETIKQVTGGKITARGMNEKAEVTFKPPWKLFVEVNPLPRAPTDDKGFRRRFKLFLWSVNLAKIPGGFEPAEVLMRRLRSELPGVFNWMIAGCLDWLATRKVPEPRIMNEALANYWAESSPLGEWLDDHCDITDRGAATPATPLYKAFKLWAEEQGHEKIMTQAAFGRQLTQRQIMAVKDRKGDKVRRGIRLRAPFGDATSAASPTSDYGDGGRENGAPSGAPADFENRFGTDPGPDFDEVPPFD